MRWRLLWASLVAAWAPLGARGGQGGEAKDDLVVVPCCGLGNRVTVLMEAMAMGVAWGMTPVLSWAAGSVLGASFEDLFEAHPDLASGARATLGPRGGGKKKKDDPEQRSDAKSGGKGTCAAEGQAARAGLGLGGAALVPVAEEVLCAGADPPRGPCVFANCGRLSSGPEGTRRFRRVADVWAPRERPALLDGAWRANGTAVSSIETFEATGGFRVTTIRVDDAKFCSDRILEWLAGLAPQAAVLRKVPKRLAGYPRDAVLGVHLRGPDPWAARGNWTSKFDLCVGAHTLSLALDLDEVSKSTADCLRWRRPRIRASAASAVQPDARITMLRSSFLRLPKPAAGRRYLNLHEYQSAAIMASHGVNVPPGIPATTVSEAVAAAKELGGDEVVIKSQILAGGRGLGTFTNGFQGGVHVIKSAETADYAEKMIGQTLVTKQSGEAGKPVNVVFMAEKMNLVNEMYFAILLDRAFGGPVVVACAEGGTSIEDLAESSPEKIVKVPIDVVAGLTDANATAIVEGLQVTGDKEAAKKQIAALYDVFTSCDCTMVEVNPLAEDDQGVLIAADAKIGFDDNASFRQKDIFAQRDESQEDPRDVAAEKWDLNYIGLDGSIGCMVNGAGLAMATMDIIQMHGGSPANFLDVGGSATKEQIVEAFKIITSDSNVKALLVNIFGGIMKCDVIAEGIVAAVKEVGLDIPLVVRLEGTNVDIGKSIIDASGLNITSADDLDDAAKKAVAAI